MATKQVKLKDQYFRLGSKAQQFVDPISGTKILKGQIVKVEGNATKSGKLKLATSGGHIVRVEKDDYDEYLTSLKTSGNKAAVTDKVDEFENDSEEVKNFRKLSDAKKRKAIQDDYELDADDLKKLNAAKGEEIVTIFKELIADEDQDDDQASDEGDDDYEDDGGDEDQDDDDDDEK